MTPLFAYFLIHRFTKSESVTRREVMKEVISFSRVQSQIMRASSINLCARSSCTQAWSNCELFQQLRTCCSRTCCSGCRFSAPAHLLLWMPIFSTCALAALDDFQQRRTCCSRCRFSGTLDADFQHLTALRTCCSGCRFSAPAHLLLWMPIFSTCALAALDADFEHLRT